MHIYAPADSMKVMLRPRWNSRQECIHLFRNNREVVAFLERRSLDGHPSRMDETEIGWPL